MSYASHEFYLIFTQIYDSPGIKFGIKRLTVLFTFLPRDFKANSSNNNGTKGNLKSAKHSFGFS